MHLINFIVRPKISPVVNKVMIIALMLASFSHQGHSQNKGAAVINMVFTSDAHYGITRAKFRGDSNVTGHRVNAAMINQINKLPNLTLPADGGVNSGKQVAYVDFIIQAGDIANRMEIPNQSAAASWAQFETDYMHKLHLKGTDGKPAKLLVIPGNHDISNAIGFSRPMKPLTDPTSMVKIYNMMLKPEKQLTNKDYNYARDKVNYSYNIKGVHIQFITLWPDSAERIWMQKDLDTVSSSTPVIIFTHDQPECESKHFTNPLPPHNMTPENRFENLTAEYYKEGVIASKDDGATSIEQRGFVKFLKAHPNIKAYFHGNSNWNEFYNYKGPDNDVNLNVFRVDSPMKGKFSAGDETRLSFQLITLDAQNKLLTVRECLWNTSPLDANARTVIGDSITVSLKTD